jgi:hypothetical protein
MRCGVYEGGGVMSHSGQNGGGKGGRNYHLNWTDTPEGAEFGDYRIYKAWSGTAFPFGIMFKGEPLLQQHGNFMGYCRLKTIENAKRWVEKRLRKCTSYIRWSR